jgi:hypothetical protein
MALFLKKFSPWNFGTDGTFFLYVSMFFVQYVFSCLEESGQGNMYGKYTYCDDENHRGRNRLVSCMETRQRASRGLGDCRLRMRFQVPWRYLLSHQTHGVFQRRNIQLGQHLFWRLLVYSFVSDYSKV